MPVNQLATISVPEPRLLTITPFDKSIMKDIERGIQESDLGLTPSNDGQIIGFRSRSSPRIAVCVCVCIFLHIYSFG